MNKEQEKQLFELLENPRADRDFKYKYDRCQVDIRERVMKSDVVKIQEYLNLAERIVAMIRYADEREMR